MSVFYLNYRLLTMDGSNLTTYRRCSRLGHSRDGIFPLHHTFLLPRGSRRAHRLRRDLTRLLPARRSVAQGRPCACQSETHRHPPREQDRPGSRRGECVRARGTKPRASTDSRRMAGRKGKGKGKQREVPWEDAERWAKEQGTLNPQNCRGVHIPLTTACTHARRHPLHRGLCTNRRQR